MKSVAKNIIHAPKKGIFVTSTKQKEERSILRSIRSIGRSTMAPKRPDGFKKSSSNEEFTKNKLNAQASLHKPNTLGYESDTNVVPSPSQNEKQNTANLKSTTERKKGVFVALV